MIKPEELIVGKWFIQNIPNESSKRLMKLQRIEDKMAFFNPILNLKKSSLKSVGYRSHGMMRDSFQDIPIRLLFSGSGSSTFSPLKRARLEKEAKRQILRAVLG